MYIKIIIDNNVMISTSLDRGTVFLVLYYKILSISSYWEISKYICYVWQNGIIFSLRKN